MSTPTVTKASAAADRGPVPAGAPRPARRRGRNPVATLASHGILAAASLIALFPIAWLVYLSLGPDKDDYLHPERIWGR